MKLIAKVISVAILGLVASALIATPSSAASMVEYAGHVSPNASMVEYAL